MLKKVLGLTSLVFLAMFMITQGTFSKYRSVVSSTSSARIAKWDNQLEIVGSDSFVLENEEVNQESIYFNVMSDSEVASRYDINVQNVFKNIELTLENDIYTCSCLVSEEMITISFQGKSANFYLNQSLQTTVVDGVTMTFSSMVKDNIQVMEISNDSNDLSLSVYLKSDNSVDVIFKNFGLVAAGENVTVPHTLSLKTSAVELPSVREIYLFATFEQVD